MLPTDVGKAQGAPQELPQPPLIPISKSKKEDTPTPAHARVTRSTGFHIKGHVEGLLTEWLVDMGCSTTILSSNQYTTMPETRCPELTPYRENLVS